MSDGSGDAPVFVVGTGRCGSTLLRKLLRVHPELYLPKETHWIPIHHALHGARELAPEEFFRVLRSVYMAKGKTAYARILGENGLEPERFEAELAPRIEALPCRDLASIMTLFYRDLARRNGATRWGDKTPDYGMCMALLQGMWPDARFVHIVRDGRDAALSMTRVPSFRLQVAWGVSYWPLLAWERAYEARLAEARGPLPLEGFFELWQRRLLRIRDEATRLASGRYLEIDYLALRSDPVAVLRRVAAFLELSEDGGWIDRAASQVRHGTRSENEGSAEYRQLSERYAPTLRSLGFGR